PPFCDRRECQACPYDGDVTQCACGRNWHSRCWLSPRGRCPDCLEEKQALQPKDGTDLVLTPPEPLVLDEAFFREVFSSPPAHEPQPDVLPVQVEPVIIPEV